MSLTQSFDGISFNPPIDVPDAIRQSSSSMNFGLDGTGELFCSKPEGTTRIVFWAKNNSFSAYVASEKFLATTKSAEYVFPLP
jgi:hypothetical protein